MPEMPEDQPRAQISDIETVVGARHEQLLANVQRFTAVEGQWRTMIGQQVQADMRAMAERAAALRGRADVRAAETLRAASESAAAAAHLLAPGKLGISWEDPQWQSGRLDLGAKQCSWLRVGHIDGAPDAPALLPLLNHAGWVVRTSGSQFSDLLLGVILRLGSVVPLHRLEVRQFDPALELRLGLFLPFRDISERSFAPATARARDFEAVLDEAVDGMSMANDAISNAGVHSLAEHWALMRTLDLPFRLIVVNGYPQGINLAVQEKLLQIARSGGAHGVTLIVRHDRAATPARDVNVKDLLNELTAVDLGGTVISTAALRNTAVSYDGPPPRSMVEDVVARIVTVNKEAAAPTVPLSDLIAAMPDRWADPDPDGVAAEYGQINRKPLTLRLWTRNPPLPNALIGGAVGQGKSNLLLSIIHSLAARYRPEDLRLYLLDFRQGVEFAALGPRADRPEWLPHADVLGLEADRAFGVAVLEHLVAELKSRGERMRGIAADIGDYRAAGHQMARIVLIVDEFQVLFEGDDSTTDRAVAALETLARLGRGFGIHLILASQTVSGIRGLAVKGEPVFAQFPNRLSLKNTARESESILGLRNTAAAQIAYRGEIIHNENSGAAESNQRGIVAYVDPQWASQLRAELWRQAGGPALPKPLVFHGGRFAEWDARSRAELAALTPGDSYRLWVGRPIAVDPAPVVVSMERNAEQGLAILGTDEAEGIGVVTSALASLAMQCRAGTRWVLLDGTTASGQPPQWLQPCIELAQAHGVRVDHVVRGEVNDYLIANGPGLLDRGPADPDTFLILLAPQMVVGLDRSALMDYSVDPYGVAPPSPKDVLADIVGRGSTVGVHTIGWWSGVRTLSALLGLFPPAGIAAYVTLTVGREELTQVCGATTAPPEGSPRVTVKDGRARPEVRVAIPFDRYVAADEGGVDV